MTDNRDENTWIVDQAVAQLMEHFDAVQIFVSKADRGVTGSCARGRGNFYARFGLVREWVTKEEHRSRLEMEAEIDADSDDDGAEV